MNVIFDFQFGYYFNRFYSSFHIMNAKNIGSVYQCQRIQHRSSVQAIGRCSTQETVDHTFAGYTD